MPTTARSLSSAFGEVVRELRQQRGLSQEGLGFACGRHRTYISALERGTSSPTIDTLWTMAGALDISPAEIVRRIEVRAPGVPIADLPPRRPRRRRTA